MDRYTVESKIRSLSFLDGYSCEAESKDHFLRHLGHRFNKCCDMNQLNNAYQSNEIIIRKSNKSRNDIFKKVIPLKKPNVVNEYWGNFGYILEINHGTVNNPVIEKRAFVSDTEANEWVNSQ